MQTHEIKDAKAWRWRSEAEDNMYQNEHDALFASIRAGKVIDNSAYMASSTLMAILGRMAAYTGQTITWEQALNSTEDLSLKAYTWSDLPTPEISVPGVTKFA